jgi:hypothetical protein
LSKVSPTSTKIYKNLQKIQQNEKNRKKDYLAQGVALRNFCPERFREIHMVHHMRGFGDRRVQIPGEHLKIFGRKVTDISIRSKCTLKPGKQYWKVTKNTEQQ